MTDSFPPDCVAVKKEKQQDLSIRSFYVYILEMENGSLYTGYAADMASRYRKHCAGKGARFTRSFKPVSIAACWLVEGKGNAMKAESFIKSRTREDKTAMIDRPQLLRSMMREKKGLVLSVRAVRKTQIKKFEKE